MIAPQMAFVLFVLNFLDAVLTIYWVRNGLATEGNHLMATLLDMGDTPFLTIKVAVGAVTAFVLYRWKEKRVARIGLTISLTVYITLMGIHFLTGLASWGYLSKQISEQLSYVGSIFAFFI